MDKFAIVRNGEWEIDATESLVSDTVGSLSLKSRHFSVIFQTFSDETWRASGEAKIDHPNRL